MANENVKVLHTRMRQKRVEASKWETAKTRTPLDGELIIYKGSWKGSTSTTSIFVGDGNKPLSSLNPIGTYNHNESELSWDGEVTVGYVGADAITVSLPKITFEAGNAVTSNGQTGVALEVITGDTAQTIGIYNTSGDNVVQYDSTNNIIKVDAPPTNHASGKTTYGISTNTEYGHVKLKKLEDCLDYTDDESALTPAAVKDAITTDIFRATTTHYGVVKPAAVRNASYDLTTGGISSSKYYGVELDSDGTMFVNVPWTYYNYYHTPSHTSGLKIATGTGASDLYVPDATTDTLGVVKLGYTTSANSYAVQKNSDDRLYVYVPNASKSQCGVVKLDYTSTGKNYAVQKDAFGDLYVNVPWTNTTYSYATANTAGLVRVSVSGNTLSLYTKS